jgi:hypothetical protein
LFLIYNGENMIEDVIEIVKIIRNGQKKKETPQRILLYIFLFITVQSILTGVEYTLKSHFQPAKSISEKWEGFKLAYWKALITLGKGVFRAFNDISEKIGNIGLIEYRVQALKGRRGPSYLPHQCPSL